MALTPFFELRSLMLVSQQHRSKQPSYQTARDNQNACTLVKTAKAAQDSASVICSRFDLLTEVPLIHTNREADPCLFPIAAYSSND